MNEVHVKKEQGDDDDEGPDQMHTERPEDSDSEYEYDQDSILIKGLSKVFVGPVSGQKKETTEKERDQDSDPTKH